METKPEFKDIILKPEAKGKVIAGYTRYEMMPDGTIRNATTGTVLKKEQKGDILQVRLTSDKGSRDWLSTEKLFNDLYQIDIENKVKPSAKPAKPASLSKSQEIWLSLQSGNTIQQVLESNPDYKEGHVRNVAKNYKSNPQKQAQAKKIQELVKAQNQKDGKEN